MYKILLKPLREQAVLRQHPWIFSGAVKKVLGQPQPGETVLVCNSEQHPLALAAYSPHSQIRARIWSTNTNNTINSEFLHHSLLNSYKRRGSGLLLSVNAYRLVNSEADGLPGVIVDVYGDYLVLQCLTAGAHYWKAAIIESLSKIVPCRGIIERSEGASLAKEGLTPSTGLVWGEMPTLPITIQEHSLKFNVDILKGHKTGFYLDQRDNRHLVQQISQGKRVLNCCAYTGGFGIAALAGGAVEVTHIETSAKFAEQIHNHVTLNSLDSAKNKVIVADVFEQLRVFQEQGERFDLIILDPPKFADSKQQLTTACRGYKDINRLAMELLKPNGDLLTFSCSGAMTTDLFSKIVADAAIDAKRQVFIHQRLWQAPDHTLSIFFPEGLYLKGLWCKVE